uniref:hypothetical protein n=1 Tax=Klebsiella sp. TaxID=576 RepID=UPI0031DAE98F
MEWIVTGIVVPFVGYIFKVWMDRRKMMFTRIEQLESKVSTAEMRISELRDDVDEIKEIREVLTDVKLDIREIKTLLHNK